jgi:hypothetical protein
VRRSCKHSKIINYLNIGEDKIKCTVDFRDVKHSRLEFHGDELHLILPKNRKNYRDLIESKRRWITRKYNQINKIIKDNKDLSKDLILFGKPFRIIHSTGTDLDIKGRRIFIDIKNISKLKNLLKTVLFEKISKLAEKYSKILNANFNRIFIRTQKTKWASCSSKRNLSFNLKLISLPDNLIEYIVFHELLHLKEKKHNQDFINLIKQKFKEFEELEKMLFSYWFILNRNKIWESILSNS